MLTKRWNPFKPHPVQRALWRCSSRFVAVPAGRGGGKTELAKRRLVRFLPVRKEWGDPRYFYGAPTHEQAKRTAWRDLKALTPKDWIAHVSESELSIETIFGSMILVVGMDKPQRIEGVQWDGCVLDESCDQKPKVFELNVLPALVWRHGWCWRIGVPKRAGVGAREFRQFSEDAATGKIENAATFTWPSEDIVPHDTLRWAQQNLDPKDYNEQFNACWETAGGGIFYAFDEEFNVRPCAYDSSRPIVVGSDFNVDPMSWVIGHAYPDRVEWVDEIFKRDTNTRATLDILWGRYSSHKSGFQFFGDATGAARKTSASKSDYKQILNDERFKKAGRSVHYPRSNPRVADRFAGCNAMFLNAAGDRRAFVDPRCKRLIDDLRVRHYKPGTSEVNDSGDIGHMTDAMGYVVSRLFPIRVEVEGDQAVVIT